jgi:hypothetical protein
MLETVPGTRCSILTLIGLLAGAAACDAGRLDQSPGAGAAAPAPASPDPGVVSPAPVPVPVPTPPPPDVPVPEPAAPGPCQQCARRDATDIVQRPLSCFCGSNGQDSCDLTLEQARREECAVGAFSPLSPGVLQVTGCGKVLLTRPSGLGYTDRIFDSGSGRLVGARIIADVVWQCGTGSFEYGDSWRRLGTRDPDCREVQTCVVCGEAPAGERFRACR